MGIKTTKRRIIKKWEKREIVEEMMRKHQARTGRPRLNNSRKTQSNWTQDYLGESSLANAYRMVQSAVPTSPLLQYGVLGEDGHFEISQRFYEEQFPGEKDVRGSTVVIRYLTLLRKEYSPYQLERASLDFKLIGEDE